VALKKKELELWEQQEKDRKSKLKQEKEDQLLSSVELQSEIKENSVPATNITPTLDAIRGIFFFATLIGDKKATKVQLEKKLKAILLTPNGFGDFLINVALYLKQI
jgi:hypothetical protein